MYNKVICAKCRVDELSENKLPQPLECIYIHDTCYLVHKPNSRATDSLIKDRRPDFRLGILGAASEKDKKNAGLKKG
jgi:hypothetical protein